MDRKFNAVDQRLNAMDGRINDLKNGLEGKLNNLEGKFNVLEADVKNTATSNSSLKVAMYMGMSVFLAGIGIQYFLERSMPVPVPVHFAVPMPQAVQQFQQRGEPVAPAPAAERKQAD